MFIFEFKVTNKLLFLNLNIFHFGEKKLTRLEVREGSDFPRLSEHMRTRLEISDDGCPAACVCWELVGSRRYFPAQSHKEEFHFNTVGTTSSWRCDKHTTSFEKKTILVLTFTCFCGYKEYISEKTNIKSNLPDKFFHMCTAFTLRAFAA